MPEILPDGRVRFVFDRPMSWPVSVVGDFNDWDETVNVMERTESGAYTLDLALKPGRYEYRFLARGSWYDDLSAKAYVANPWGGENAVVDVPETAAPARPAAPMRARSTPARRPAKMGSVRLTLAQ
jgi:1,4-alpha-glucan branching enzyme